MSYLKSFPFHLSMYSLGSYFHFQCQGDGVGAFKYWGRETLLTSSSFFKPSFPHFTFVFLWFIVSSFIVNGFHSQCDDAHCWTALLTSSSFLKPIFLRFNSKLTVRDEEEGRFSSKNKTLQIYKLPWDESFETKTGRIFKFNSTLRYWGNINHCVRWKKKKMKTYKFMVSTVIPDDDVCI